MVYAEGFIATTNETVEDHPLFTLESLYRLRDCIHDQPWLYSPWQDSSGTPIGRVAWGEVVPVGNGFGLWARTEFYRREALQLTSAGILRILGFLPEPQTTP